MDGYGVFEVVMEVELAHPLGSSDETREPRQVRTVAWNVAFPCPTLAEERWKDRALGEGA